MSVFPGSLFPSKTVADPFFSSYSTLPPRSSVMDRAKFSLRCCLYNISFVPTATGKSRSFDCNFFLLGGTSGDGANPPFVQSFSCVFCNLPITGSSSPRRLRRTRVAPFYSNFGEDPLKVCAFLSATLKYNRFPLLGYFSQMLSCNYAPAFFTRAKRPSLFFPLVLGRLGKRLRLMVGAGCRRRKRSSAFLRGKWNFTSPYLSGQGGMVILFTSPATRRCVSPQGVTLSK